MDKFTKNYIDDIVKPMIHRIQSLQKTNEQLKLQVKYLESLIMSSDKAYQKPTLSAANHMRDSRISSKGESSEKRPGWNSKTKVQPSPNAINKQKEAAVHYQKIKTKPPIPKTMKSPNKNQLTEDMRNSAVDKRFQGTVKLQAENNQNKLGSEGSPQISPVKQQKTNGELKQTRLKEPEGFNNKFEQLVKNNTEILTSMKQSTQKETIKLPPNNYVQKVVAPKSQYNHSQSTSPHERSFASQSHQQKTIIKLVDGVKSIQTIQIK